ncbi:VPLPA-CTERM sorting domain-containing protein [Ruegeria pomeroyi]|nr:VPLPA-CTERM sorting domain-containing protein [Ruegeria pomeroyi]
MKTLATIAMLALTSGAAQAAVIDFTGTTQGSVAGPVTIPGATITADAGDSIIIGTSAAGESDGFCFRPSNIFRCTGSGILEFASAVTGLTFDIDGASSGDNVSITAFNDLTALSTLNFTTNGLVDFSGFSSITSLQFTDNASTASGVGYSTFTYELAAVPLPAGGLLLIGALGALGMTRRRKT